VRIKKITDALQSLSTRDLIVAGVTIVLAALGGCFIVIAEEMMEGETLSIDNAILKFLRNPNNLNEPIGPSWLLSTMLDISALGGLSITIIALFVVAGYFALSQKYRLMIFLFISIGGGSGLMFLLKGFFSRPRPSVVPHLQQLPVTASFPSGHSMVSAIMYLTFAAMLAKTTKDYKLKMYYMFVGIMLTAAVGLSRVYLGVHYPSDVLAGWCAGAVWAGLTYLIGDWLETRGTVEKER
jgi:undecaprenyl-diphosphatase